MAFIDRRKGLYLNSRKNTENNLIMPITLPKIVKIPMTQGLATACRPLVKAGDLVGVGQLIGNSRENYAVPIHSSVSGKVLGIEKAVNQQGFEDLHIVIESDGRQEAAKNVLPPEVKNREDFIAAVRSCGLQGLGSLGFSTAVKFESQNPEHIHTLVLNGAECEPFVTSDYQNMLAYADEILYGAKEILKWLSLKNCIIALQADKKEAIRLFQEKCSNLENFSVKILPRSFPFGEESLIAQEICKKPLPVGKHPCFFGLMVSNIVTVLKLSHFLITGMPLVSRTITVDGDVVSNPMNVEVPIGTSISELLDFCNTKKEKIQKIIAGGPMTGKALSNYNFSIIKTNKAILCFSSDYAKADKQTPCIHCGACIKACPKGLMPLVLYDLALKKDGEKLKNHNIEACIACGCCSYQCPARRPLSYIISSAKETLEYGK